MLVAVVCLHLLVGCGRTESKADPEQSAVEALGLHSSAITSYGLENDLAAAGIAVGAAGAVDATPTAPATADSQWSQSTGNDAVGDAAVDTGDALTDEDEPQIDASDTGTGSKPILLPTTEPTSIPIESKRVRADSALVPTFGPALFGEVVGAQVNDKPGVASEDGSANLDGAPLVPDRIVIPSIELDTSVVDLGWKAATDPSGRVLNNWDVAAYSAGWHVNSDRLGEGGNVVLSGHNNMLGAVFRELDQLKSGDVATLWSGNRRYEYEIDKVVIVPERDATHEQRLDNARWIGEFSDNRVTLVSCWPRDDNSHRIIVVGRFVGDAIESSPTLNKGQ